MSEKQILGSCSICNGQVTLPVIWFGIIPPEPTCESCGAVRARPVIQMQPCDWKITTTTKEEG